MKPLYWRLGGVAVALLVLIAAWFAVISPQRSKAGDLETARQDQLAQSATLEAKISLLKKQAEELPRKEAELAAIGQKLPASTAIPSLIRTLNRTAKRAKVTLSTLTPGQPTPVKVATAAGAGTPTTTASDPSAQSSAAPGAEQSASATPRAAGGAAQVQAIPVTMTACGTYSQLRQFLVGLESMKRAMLVTGLNIGKGSCEGTEDDASALTAAITASVFTMPSTLPATGTQPTPAASAMAGGAR